jgi:hypothetical protein
MPIFFEEAARLAPTVVGGVDAILPRPKVRLKRRACDWVPEAGPSSILIAT